MHDTMMLHTSWNTSYILLSVIIAVITSGLALELARRYSRVGGTIAPVILGAVLGYGIWAMHFVGMLAMQIPVGVAYGLPLTLISGVSAIGFLVAASVLLFKGTPTIPRILTSGAIAGTGIVLMHYVGMAALQLNATPQYNPLLVGVSVLIAVGAASVAFYLFSRVIVVNLTRTARTTVQLGASLVMGAAIAGMHYTGMAAISYLPQPLSTTLVSGVDIQGLFYLVLGLTLTVFVSIATFLFIEASAKTSTPLAGD
ncbi:MHYT domain-containing protein [Deinococcus alpinitundrae]|uniref:MHYT domain-containing protein n=1 Tax=Deinococcus alpinitundrae TaxID=468913 RepID=UPI00137B8669|nr:MHYT domain-containing protein [Deinococcus alpinitundrae]